MINPDGSAYNDGNNSWKGTTVFSCINFIKTLNHFGNVLKPDFKAEIENRVKHQAEWVYNFLDTTYWSNINYYAGAASCMALAGQLLGKEKYIARSREMTDYCMRHFTENGLLMCEGHPHDGYTETGCRLVDIGYDFEESIPCLTDAAEALGDEETLKNLAKYMADTVDLFLPDGGMDNSFGTRNNKWTYFGSRTSDGCVAALIILSKYQPILLEAAIRNIDLQEALTSDGLLYGGPHYKKTGQKPCVHHTFCHAAGLADALLVGLSENMPRVKLPSENGGFSFKYYPEVDTYKITAGDWLATVTGCDNDPSAVGSGATHCSGGTLSLLYHKDLKQVIAGSTYSYRLAEPLNLQLPNEFKFAHRRLIPRAELNVGKTVYTNIFDNRSEIKVCVEGQSVKVFVKARLCNSKGQAAEYTLTPDKNGDIFVKLSKLSANC